MQQITPQWVKAAIAGGAILGGGGGGSAQDGQRFAELALQRGVPKILEVSEYQDDTLILIVSAVGAPTSRRFPSPTDYVKAVQLLRERVGEIGGLMTNELGGLAVVNGLLQSAALGIPLIDAACNGRAHPTAAMGSIGLSRKASFVSHQVGVGGFNDDGSRVEVYAKGTLSATSRVIRKAAEIAGGAIAVARNPIPASYVRENAAVGALSQAVRVGNAFLKGKSGLERIKKAVSAVHGRVVTQGRVNDLELATEGGFDVGKVSIQGYTMTFWNEYMTLEKDIERLATFPDLIVTMATQTGKPVSSAELQEGQEITVFVVPKEDLILGAGMRDPELFRDVEKVVRKEIVRYVFQKKTENAR